MFVGRAHELRELERVLDAAQAGRGTTVLVAGEAGIGKTRLAAELAARAADRGFAVLVGRSIDLVGTELPYQPFVEALGPLPREAGSQLRVFETTLALLADRADPVLLVLEDVHWADTSTLDLVVFLAHNLTDQRVVLLATYRDSLGRFVESVRRAGSVLTLDLAPLPHDDVIALLADAPGASAIATRSGGNPFFAEELLAAGGELPGSLRDLLLQRVSGLDQAMLRLIAAAGRDVGPSLLRPADRESLRQAVDQGVLVADQAAGTFRFRHALLAEAVYATILPGEREELHGRLAEELARSGAAAAELAPHWAAAGRSEEAFAASVTAAEDAEAVYALTEALAHLERAIALWPEVPDAPDLADLCHRAAELAVVTGAAPRAVALAERAIAEATASQRRGAAARGSRPLPVSRRPATRPDRGVERAVSLVPAEPPSPERAQALVDACARSPLAGGTRSRWRSASWRWRLGAVARHVARRRSRLPRPPRGGPRRSARRVRDRRCRRSCDATGLWRADRRAHDAGPAARVGPPRRRPAGSKLQPSGIDQTTLIGNRIEALVATGEWDEADARQRRGGARDDRQLLALHADRRATLETGRGDFAPRGSTWKRQWRPCEDAEAAICDADACELALWERRWARRARRAHRLARVRSRETAQDPRLAVRQRPARRSRAGGARTRSP